MPESSEPNQRQFYLPPIRQYQRGEIGASPDLRKLRERWSEAHIQCPHGIAEVRLGSWREFAYYVQEMLVNAPALIFRGHGDAAWEVKSSFDRLMEAHPMTRRTHFPADLDEENYFPAPPTDFEKHMMAFKELSGLKAGMTAIQFSETEWCAIAQHHGLPTPLVDWTLSPFVALYFAFEERWLKREENDQAFLYEPQERVVYWAASHFLDKGKGAEPPANSPAVYAPRPDITPRSEFQGSVLVRAPKGISLDMWARRHWQTDEAMDLGGPILGRIVIPNDKSERIECLKFLKAMNITRASLFPDLDGAAKHVTNLWDLGWSTLHGYLRRMPTGLGADTSNAKP